MRGGPGFNGFRGVGGRPGLGFGFPFQNRFGFGGFRGGFGFGLGWGGWGWGGWGWGLGWDPCWGFGWSWDPYCFGFAAWPAYPPYGYGYGYYGYSDPVADPYPPSVNYDPNDSPDSLNNYPQPSDSVTPAPPSLIDPNWDTGANAPYAAAQSDRPVVIYLKDGSSFLPTDYWMIDDEFHYTLGGREYIVPLSRVDLQKTNDVNRQNGATFWLKSAPDASPAPGAAAPATPPSDKSPTKDAGPATL